MKRAAAEPAKPPPGYVPATVEMWNRRGASSEQELNHTNGRWAPAAAAVPMSALANLSINLQLLSQQLNLLSRRLP